MQNKFSRSACRIIAAALAIALVGGIAPVQPIAEMISTGITVKAQEDQEKISCSFSDGVLTLHAGTYNNPYIPYEDDDNNSFSKYDVEEVKTDGKIVLTGSCEDLFRGYSSVKKIDLTNVDTSAVTSMKSMFSYCYVLAALTVGTDFKTGSVTDMSGMFQSCGNIEGFDFSKLDTSNVTNMSNLFYNSSFKALNLSGFDTSKVTDMSGMFYSCNYLESLDLDGWRTGSVTDFSNMFKDCHVLKNLDLRSFDTSSAGSMFGMFSYDYDLESITLGSGFNTSGISSMSSMFNGCSKLKSIDLSKFNTSNVTDMSYMFFGCYSLEAVNVSGFDTANVTDMSDMFENCSSLTSLDLSNFTVNDSLNTYGIFGGCKSLDSIKLPSGFVINEDMELSGSDLNYKGWAKSSAPTVVVSSNNSYGYVESGMSEAGEYIHVKSDIEYEFDFDTKTLTVKAGTFDGNLMEELYNEIKRQIEVKTGESIQWSYVMAIEKMIINDGVVFTGNCDEAFYIEQYGGGTCELVVGNVDTSAATSMSGMFRYCKGNFDLSSFDTSNVTDMSEMFQYCDANVKLGNGFKTSNVTNMNSMFESFHGSFDFSKLNTANVTDMSRMFSGCGCSAIDLSTFDFGNVSSYDQMFQGSCFTELDLSSFTISNPSFSSFFYGCNDLKKVKMPSGAKPSQMYDIFHNCASLESIDFNGMDFSGINDIGSMFEGCSSIKEIDLSGLDMSNVVYLSETFKGCSSLKKIVLPELSNSSIYSLSNMFDGCTSLTSVNLDNIKTTNLSYLDEVFKNCSSLEEVDISHWAFENGSYCAMYSIFEGCTSLKKVKLFNFPSNYSSNKEGSYYRDMFKNAINLTEIDIPGNIQFTKNQALENENTEYCGWYRISDYDGEHYMLNSDKEYATFTTPGSVIYRDKRVISDSTVIGASLTLEGQIGLNFYALLPESVRAENSGAYVLMDGPSGKMKVMIKDAEFDRLKGYKFTYRVAAKEIHEKVSFAVYDKDNNLLDLLKKTSKAEEAVEGNVYSYSVGDYDSYVRANYGTGKLRDLVDALEVYASYAKKYFNYHTESNVVTNDVSSVTSGTLNGYKYNKSSLPDGVVFKGYSLLLRSETCIKLYFELSDPDRYYFTEFGSKKEFISDGKGLYYVTISNISAQRLTNNVYLSLYDTKEQEYGSDKYVCYLACSPMSYAYSVLKQLESSTDEKNIALCNTMRALYLYGEAAKNYFKS